MSTNKPLLSAIAHKKKIDFGLLLVGRDSSFHAPVSPGWGTVEVIGEHTDQKELTHGEFLSFVDYARFCWIFNLDRTL